MNKDRYEYWIKTATTVIDAYTALNHACHKAQDAGCLDAEGPLYDAIWRAFEDLLRIIDTVGVGKFETGWITWFIYEAPHSPKKTAEIKHKHKTITYDVSSVEGLAELITDLETEQQTEDQ